MKTRGLLLVHVDPEPAFEDEVNAWYDTEHLPERAAVPGFETAMRFRSLDDGPRYLAVYDLEELAVLQSEGYLAVSGDRFSPWTKRVNARARPVRMTARQASDGGVTGSCTRLALFKFAASSASDASAVEAGLKASFGAHPGHLNSRVFIGAEPQPDFLLAIMEFAGNDVPPLAIEAFGETGRRLVLAATYRPYRA